VPHTRPPLFSFGRRSEPVCFCHNDPGPAHRFVRRR